MILVVSAGSWENRYSPLQHADWFGWTWADMVFPLFLFAVGLAMTFSFSAAFARGASRSSLALKVLRRAATLLIMGLVLNALPAFHLATLRIPGILQRIAACYALAGLLILAFWKTKEPDTRRLLVMMTASVLVILILYWALLAFVSVPGFGAGRLDSAGSLPAYLDRSVFGIPHLWPYGLTPGQGVTYDPEGLLSTLPATATVLLGLLCGFWLRLESRSSKRVLGLVVAGVLLVVAGLLLHPIIPIAKKIWTDSFVLFSGGVAMLVFAISYWLSDIRKLKAWDYVLRVFGANAILAFVLSQVIGAYSDRPWPIRAVGFAALHSLIPSARAASLAYAVANLGVICLILLPLYRRRKFLRV